MLIGPREEISQVAGDNTLLVTHHHHQQQKKQQQCSRSNRPALSRASSGASVVQNCCPPSTHQARLQCHDHLHPTKHPSSTEVPASKSLPFSASTSAATTISSLLSPPESPMPAARGVVPMTTTHPSVIISGCKRPQQSTSTEVALPLYGSPSAHYTPHVLTDGAAPYVVHRSPFPWNVWPHTPPQGSPMTDSGAAANRNVYSKSTSFAVEADSLRNNAKCMSEVNGTVVANSGQFSLMLPSVALSIASSPQPMQHSATVASSHKGCPPSPDGWWQDTEGSLSTLDVPRLPHSERNSPAASSNDGNGWRPYASLGPTGSTQVNSVVSKHLSSSGSAATQQSLRDEVRTAVDPSVAGGGTSWLHRRIAKTKLCVHHVHGRCARGASCTFAHNKNELREPPDLYKTRLCINFGNFGRCQKGDNCRFAHGMEELRTSEGELACPPSELGGQGGVLDRTAALDASAKVLVGGDPCEEAASLVVGLGAPGGGIGAASVSNLVLGRVVNQEVNTIRSVNKSGGGSGFSNGAELDEPLSSVMPQQTQQHTEPTLSVAPVVGDDAPSTPKYPLTAAATTNASTGTSTNFRNNSFVNAFMKMPRDAQAMLLLRWQAGLEQSEAIPIDNNFCDDDDAGLDELESELRGIASNSMPVLNTNFVDKSQSQSVSASSELLDISSTCGIDARTNNTSTFGDVHQQWPISSSTKGYCTRQKAVNPDNPTQIIDDFTNFNGCSANANAIWNEHRAKRCDVVPSTACGSPKRCVSSQGLSIDVQCPPPPQPPSTGQRVQCYDHNEASTYLNAVTAPPGCFNDYQQLTHSGRLPLVHDQHQHATIATGQQCKAAPRRRPQTYQGGSADNNQTICLPSVDCHANVLDCLDIAPPRRVPANPRCTSENSASMRSGPNRSVALQAAAADTNQASIAEHCMSAIGIIDPTACAAPAATNSLINELSTYSNTHRPDANSGGTHDFVCWSRCEDGGSTDISSGDIRQSLRALRRSQSDVTNVNFGRTAPQDEYCGNYVQGIGEGASNSPVERSRNSLVFPDGSASSLQQNGKRLNGGDSGGERSSKLIGDRLYRPRQSTQRHAVDYDQHLVLGGGVGMLNEEENVHLTPDSIWSSAASLVHELEREQAMRQFRKTAQKVEDCNSGNTSVTTTTTGMYSSEDSDNCSAIARCFTAYDGSDNGSGSNSATGLPSVGSDTNLEVSGDRTNSSSSSGGMNTERARHYTKRHTLSTSEITASVLGSGDHSPLKRSLTSKHLCGADCRQREVGRHYSQRPSAHNCRFSDGYKGGSIKTTDLNYSTTGNNRQPYSHHECSNNNMPIKDSNRRYQQHHQKMNRPQKNHITVQPFGNLDHRSSTTDMNSAVTASNTAGTDSNRAPTLGGNTHFNWKPFGGSLQPFRRSSSELVGVVDTRLVQQQYARHGQHQQPQQQQQHTMLPSACSAYENCCAMNKDFLRNADVSRPAAPSTKQLNTDRDGMFTSSPPTHTKESTLRTGGISNNQTIAGIRGYFKQQLLTPVEDEAGWTANSRGGGASSKCGFAGTDGGRWGLSPNFAAHGAVDGALCAPPSVHLDLDDQEVMSILRMLGQ